MRVFDTIYIDGAFRRPLGSTRQDLIDPSTGEVSGAVTLGDRADAIAAIAAARRAFPTMSRTTKAERLDMLRRMHTAVSARIDDLKAAFVEEYGAPVSIAAFATEYGVRSILDVASVLEDYPFIRWIRDAEVVMEPLGVVGIITPWNGNTSFICNKLATAIAAGCTAVIKPSEISARQTQVLTEALHAAALPPGVFNIVNGRGDVVGDELSRHPDIAKISFTGSTEVGKAIARAAAETLKRVTLELGGKSPTLILADANLPEAASVAVTAGFRNNGQACIAGSRIIAPRARLGELLPLLKATVDATVTGDPRHPSTQLGPLASKAQWERVQEYIAVGRRDGATLLTGGEGRPAGLDRGFFVRPTVFCDVTNDMRIAREEIFGPVLSVIAYDREDEGVEIANDTPYGLRAYVLSGDPTHAHAVASQLLAGQVLMNGLHNEPLAPFGGFKQSGLGRELGAFGLEAHLEPKVLLGRRRPAAVQPQRAPGAGQSSTAIPGDIR